MGQVHAQAFHARADVAPQRGIVGHADEPHRHSLRGKILARAPHVAADYREKLEGQLKNALGRPALYAMNSLLPGGNTGLWHVTIGNPKNPIAAIGNLILDDAEITHHGALGIDDFPSELKVVVKLKHAKPRDMVDIARMYTQGVSGFYNQPVNHPVSSFYMYDENTKFNDIE